MDKKTNSSKYYSMSDDMALGCFDADGTVNVRVEKLEDSGMSFYVNYGFEQSSSKRDLVNTFGHKFGVEDNSTGPVARCRLTANTELGRRFRLFLQKNQPKAPGRYRDFLLSELILNKVAQGFGRTNTELIALAYVSSKFTVKASKGDESLFEENLKHLKASSTEKRNGIEIGRKLVETVESQVNKFIKSLPTTVFSDDYVRGSHYGDGSFTVTLPWLSKGNLYIPDRSKPPANWYDSKKLKPWDERRLRCEPNWSISAADPDYCAAFNNTFAQVLVNVKCGAPSGYVGSVNKGADQRKVTVRGTTKCAMCVKHYFSNLEWMPAYKQQQLNNFNEMIQILSKGQHFTKEGLINLVKLASIPSEKGARKHSAQGLMFFGLRFLKARSQEKLLIDNKNGWLE